MELEFIASRCGPNTCEWSGPTTRIPFVPSQYRELGAVSRVRVPSGSLPRCTRDMFLVGYKIKTAPKA